MKATSHWKSLNLLKDFGAIPTRERFVVQEKIITAAGVSSGIDMALYLCDKIVGEKETRAIQLIIEYDPNPIYYSANYLTADKEIIKAAEMKLTKDAKKELELMDLLKSYKTLLKMK